MFRWPIPECWLSGRIDLTLKVGHCISDLSSSRVRTQWWWFSGNIVGISQWPVLNLSLTTCTRLDFQVPACCAHLVGHPSAPSSLSWHSALEPSRSPSALHAQYLSSSSQVWLAWVAWEQDGSNLKASTIISDGSFGVTFCRYCHEQSSRHRICHPLCDSRSARHYSLPLFLGQVPKAKPT